MRDLPSKSCAQSNDPTAPDRCISDSARPPFAAPAAATRGPSATDGSPRIVVIGIGNNLLGDDGAGVHVVEHMRDQVWAEPVEFLDGGTLSFSLLEYIEAADRLIVIDAAYLDAAPGTVKVYRNGALERFLTGSRRPSVHEVNLLDVLGAARLRGRLPPDCILVAIEPGMIDWSPEPSPEVEAAIGKACARVADLIREEFP